MSEHANSYKIEPIRLDAVRRHAGVPVAADEAGWTACTGPSTTLVINQDGSIRGCEGSSDNLCSGGSLLRAWESPAFEELRKELAEGSLPGDHCRGCVHWLSGELIRSAPLMRDYPASADPDRAKQGPSRLILRLPLADPSTKGILQDVDDLAPTLDEITLDASSDSDFCSPFVSELLSRITATGSTPTLTVRTRGDDPTALQQALQAHTIHRLEGVIGSNDVDAVMPIIKLAETLEAACYIRFVFTPANWFQFEPIAQLCAQANVKLDLRVLDHDGQVPLEALATEDLMLVRDAVASTSTRLTNDDSPSSLTPNAHADITDEMRQLLRARTQRELSSPNELPTDSLRLPPPEHAWCQAPLDDWWIQHLLSQAGLPSLKSWLHDSTSSHHDLLHREEGTWLRALVQQLAHDHHDPECLELLRTIYRDAEQRKLLIEQDFAFANRFDLTRYGGPWATSLGLAQDLARKLPFELTKVNAQADSQPDVTVLIPSFRHEDFIEDTLRSVLAQHYSSFKVLVVDDCSPDETVARANSINDDRIAVHRNSENLGLGNSLLKALETIDTPYVAILNSDDLFHPDRLGKCRDVLEQHAHVQLVTTGIQLVDQNGGQLTPTNASLVLDGKQVFDWVHWFQRITPTEELAQEDLFAELLERNFLVTSSNLVARTDWLRSQATGLRSLKYCLDWQLFLEAALEGGLHHLHDPLIAYRLHAGNTVWFREGRRWSYYLEVSRVASEALQRFIATDQLDPAQKLEKVIESVACHLASNTEMDGLALFLNCALDALQLDEAAANSPAIQKLIEDLNLRAERQRQAKQQFEAPPAQPNQQHQTLNLLLGTLAGEQEQLERKQKQWLQTYNESLERRIHASWLHRDQLEANKKTLYEDQKKRIASTDLLEERLREALSKIANIREERGKLSTKYDDVALRLEDRKRELDAAQSRIQTLQKQRSKALHEAAQLSEDRKQVLDEAQSRIQTLQKQRSKALHEAAQLSEEIDRLGKTREFRTGHFIWNKTPLGYMSRRAKKWYRRLLNAKDRATMMFKRNRMPKGTAVVAACWQWPIYSHTFVYQEMISLKNTGLDVQMFHWDLGDTEQLHAAFQSLYENRTQLQPVWESHKNDKEHFEKTKPGKLRSFLERISQLSGKSVEELEKEPIVLQGCTFARMAELINARYLHSYFFYDQSFMAMQAAWLLDLPRGVSCYADHMMDDYPWKFVPLHIELCDVIVATSARIKSELSGLSGGKFDDKIIVKPNGVDGERFPSKNRGHRQPGEPFEVLSVSRIEPKKGLTHIVEAIAELNKRGHTVIAHIIGAKDEHSKGSLKYAAEFEACIAEHKLQDQIILHGMMKQEQMPPIIDKCRAFVAPYVETETGDKDGIPTAMLEALASSLPVITTNSGSIVEVINHDVEGLVVAQGDSMAFANALETVITDSAVEQRMAKAARERFDKDFDIRVTEQRLHERITGFLESKS